MTTFSRIFAIALAFVASTELCANLNEYGPNTALKKRFSVAAIPNYEFDSVILKLDIALNDNWSSGLLIPVPGAFESGLFLSGHVGYYFNSFSNDSWFLSSHIGTHVLPISNGEKSRSIVGGLNLGHRYIFSQKFIVEPMLFTIYAPRSRAIAGGPMLGLGYTW